MTEPAAENRSYDCGKPYEYTNAWGTLICPLCWEDP
jgi:hypothetical protein